MRVIMGAMMILVMIIGMTANAVPSEKVAEHGLVRRPPLLWPVARGTW
jgi:hypothetical protein